MPIPEANIVFSAQVPLEVGPNQTGLPLEVTAAPSSIALPTPRDGDDVISLYFDGVDALDVWYAIGDSETRATLGDTVVVRGAKETFSLSIEGLRCTHISLRTRSGSTVGTLNFFRRGQ